MQSLPTPYQTMIHKSRYARFLEEENRRETWPETVDRYVSFFQDRHDRADIPWDELRSGILNLEIMPSMRAMMTAGPALNRDNIAGYNCSYFAVDDTRVFSEAMLILMCGTGVGFSVERHHVHKLPRIPEVIRDGIPPVVVEDSKDGWSQAFRELIDGLFLGYVRPVDYSRVRPAGERLKIFGGRASGPEPLRRLFEFTVETFKRRAGLGLRPIDCHDILCMVGDVVVCGGVRRSALISLSDLDDAQLRDAKSVYEVIDYDYESFSWVDIKIAGTYERHPLPADLSSSDKSMLTDTKTVGWWTLFPHRALANNSAVHHGAMTRDEFFDEWDALRNSGSGERGIFSREASVKWSPERRAVAEFGTNPCAEIVLRSKQFCNLTEVVVREDDTSEDLFRKVRLATILGTLQAGLDHLPKLSPEWEKNTKEEALLGVSMTGICDHPMLSMVSTTTKRLLNNLREHAVEVNAHTANVLCIKPAAAVTCVKPSGTVSQLVDSASGMHARHSNHYIRTVRMDNKDPFAVFMQQAGFPNEVDVMNPNNLVFSFPVKAPDDCVTRNDMSAIEQLELWLMFQEYWCEHKPSITVSVRDDEWDLVGEWVWKHRDRMSGVSFLPHSDHTYQQAPYQECDEATYEELLSRIPDNVDLEAFVEYADNTTGSQELACVGGVCDIA